MRRAPPSILLAAALALAGCASPTPPAASAARVDTSVPVREFERGLRERADAAARAGRLADAADAWEILTVLRPDEAGYRERLEATRRELGAAADDHLQRARLAFKRGELDGAAAQYQAVLALRPGDQPAADALRAIERERNRRALQKKAASAARKAEKLELDAPAAPGTPSP